MAAEEAGDAEESLQVLYSLEFQGLGYGLRLRVYLGFGAFGLRVLQFRRMYLSIYLYIYIWERERERQNKNMKQKP